VKLGLLYKKKNTDCRDLGRRVVRGIFGPKREEITGGGEKCITRSFVSYLQ
jgi:hypothetical protein